MKITTITTVLSCMILFILDNQIHHNSWGDIQWITFSLSLFLFLIAVLLGILIDTTIGAVEIIEKTIKDK